MASSRQSPTDVSWFVAIRPAESELHLALEPTRYQRAGAESKYIPSASKSAATPPRGNATVKSGDRNQLEDRQTAGQLP